MLSKHITAPAPRMIMRLLAVHYVLQQTAASITANPVITEIGPGLGDAASFLCALLTPAAYRLCDISAHSRLSLHRRFDGDGRFSIHAQVSELAGQADLVCAFEVMEHIEDDADFLAQLKRHLKPGGILLGSVPAFAHKWQRADEIAGHYRRYDRLPLQNIMQRTGFTVLSIQGYGFPVTNILYPLRELYYASKKTARTPTEKLAATLTSGTDRSWVKHLHPGLITAMLQPFSQLQLRPELERFADGFVLCATNACQ